MSNCQAETAGTVKYFSVSGKLPQRAGLRRAVGRPTMAASVPKPADFLRVRFRELARANGVSQTTLCARLTKRTGKVWTASRLSKILNGRIVWTVDDLVLMAEAGGVSLVEMMREPGREFYADLTPSEQRVLQLAREHESLLPTLLHVARLAEQSKPVSYRAQLRARQAKIKARMETPED